MNSMPISSYQEATNDLLKLRNAGYPFTLTKSDIALRLNVSRKHLRNVVFTKEVVEKQIGINFEEKFKRRQVFSIFNEIDRELYLWCLGVIGEWE